MDKNKSGERNQLSRGELIERQEPDMFEARNVDTYE
jgi:hypothetical protein